MLVPYPLLVRALVVMGGCGAGSSLLDGVSALASLSFVVLRLPAFLRCDRSFALIHGGASGDASALGFLNIFFTLH